MRDTFAVLLEGNMNKKIGWGICIVSAIPSPIVIWMTATQRLPLPLLITYCFVLLLLYAMAITDRTDRLDRGLKADLRQLLFRLLRSHLILMRAYTTEAITNPTLAKCHHESRRQLARDFLSLAARNEMAWEELKGIIVESGVDIRILRDVVEGMSQTNDWAGPKPKWADTLALAVYDAQYMTWPAEEAVAFETSQRPD